ncbi:MULTISPECIES: hypothetical protein [Streptomyces]|uniref:Uncharacterized protein n=1 Tax=Streptomyces pseudovenezuelae TaxID=67350 RepID=A0A101MYH3_9ACTN|nr:MULTISPECIES: hypothetical protein [Streptomyces]KUM83299.1 hypothetical protein AQI94_37195 [Streptomyces pseudovenezuelae]
MNEIPLEEAEPARKAFGDLTEGEREVVRAALAAIARDPAVGREIPGWRPPSLAYTHTPGLGVTVVYYFRDPQVLD